MQSDENEERLYYALDFNDAALLGILIRDGINVNMTFDGSNQLGKSALHLCCEKGSLECAKLLLSNGACTNLRDKWYQTPLMYAICTERDDMVELLIDAGCDLNVRDRHGKSALHHAISNVGTSCIDLLIKAGAQLDIGDSLGCTPLWHVACSDGSRHHLECLIAAGASVNICDGREKRIPLQASLIHTKKDTLTYVKLLLNAGSELDTFDHFGNSLLMSIIRRNKSLDGRLVSQIDLDLLKVIIDAGHNINLIHCQYYWFQFRGTALKMACERGAVQIVQILLENGANPNLTDENGASPLLTAVRCNHLEVGQLLIEANCDLNKIGEVTIGDSHILITPFRCAVMLKYWQFAELLVYAGCCLSEERYLWNQQEVPQTLVTNLDFWQWLNEVVSTPRSLQFLCRKFIRNKLNIQLTTKLELLHLPKRLKDYLLLPLVHL